MSLWILEVVCKIIHELKVMSANHTDARLCLLSSHAGCNTVLAEIAFKVHGPVLLRVSVHIMV